MIGLMAISSRFLISPFWVRCEIPEVFDPFEDQNPQVMQEPVVCSPELVPQLLVISWPKGSLPSYWSLTNQEDRPLLIVRARLHSHPYLSYHQCRPCLCLSSRWSLKEKCRPNRELRHCRHLHQRCYQCCLLFYNMIAFRIRNIEFGL